MKKIVTTEMSDTSLSVTIKFLESSSDEFTPHAVQYGFPVSLVNPRIALQIASLLVSDPTCPKPSSKSESDEIFEDKEK